MNVANLHRHSVVPFAASIPNSKHQRYCSATNAGASDGGGGVIAKDEEGQRRPRLSDLRNAEVRPLAGGCRPPLRPAALPVAEQSSREGVVTSVGVERPPSTPASPGQALPSLSDRHLGARAESLGMRAGRRSSRCVGSCLPTSAETPIERASVARCDEQGVNRRNGSSSRVSPGGRLGAPLPRVRGPLDQADRRPSRPLTGDDQGLLLRPDRREGEGGQGSLRGGVPRLRRLHPAA